jgi:PKD repeat protein
MKKIFLFIFLLLCTFLSGQNTWTRKADFPGGGRYNMVGFVIDNKAYVGTGSAGGTYSAEMFRYDPSDNTWKQLADFPGGGRWSPVMFAVNGKGYLCLGFDNYSILRRDVWEFDPGTQIWTQKGDFPGNGRYGISAFVIGNKAYLPGGSIDQGNTYLNELWCYNPSTDTWTQKSNIPTEHSTGQVSFTINNKGYLGTGLYDSYTPVSDFYEYDPAMDTWTTIADFPVISAGSVAFQIRGKAYAGTGTDLNVIRKHFWSYSPGNTNWSSIPDPPAEFTTRYMACGFSIGDTGYVVGGLTDGNLDLDDTWAFSGCIGPVAGFTYSVHEFDVAFNDSSTNALSYFWNFGDGTTSVTKDPNHIYQTGTYWVCHAVANDCNSDTTCEMITISCREPVSHFVYYSSNLDVQYTDSSTYGHLLAMVWDFGDSTYSTLQNPLHTYHNTGTYTACLTIADSCGINTSCQQVDLYLPMSLDIIINQSINNDLLAQFTDKTLGTTYWNWSFGDGDTSSEQNPYHLYKQYGTYNVCLTAGNIDHRGTKCDDFLLTVNPVLHLEKPVLVYPNPTNGIVNLKYYKSFANAELEVFDQAGKQALVLDLPLVNPGNPVSIDLTGFPKGVWYFKLITTDFTRIWKIVLY